MTPKDQKQDREHEALITKILSYDLDHFVLFDQVCEDLCGPLCFALYLALFDDEKYKANRRGPAQMSQF